MNIYNISIQYKNVLPSNENILVTPLRLGIRISKLYMISMRVIVQVFYVI